MKIAIELEIQLLALCEMRRESEEKLEGVCQFLWFFWPEKENTSKRKIEANTPTRHPNCRIPREIT